MGVPVVAAIAGLVSIGLVVAALAGMGHLFSARNTAAAAAVNMNCTLIVPANPLSAQGLATPYRLTATDPANGPCNEANANQTAFVQGAVINPATGAISVYNPLVIDQGTQPAVTPAVPTLPAGGIVAVWFGFNGNTLSFLGADQPVPDTQPTTASPTASPTMDPTTTEPTPTASTTTEPTPTATAPTPTATPTETAAPTATATSTATANAITTRYIYRHPTYQRHQTYRSHHYHATTPTTNGDVPAASGTPDAILQGANCVAGESIQGTFSSFTQVGACNAVAFFQTANAAIHARKLSVPNPGRATDGQLCLTTRSFALIDQDQSDNVTSEYLANGNGQIAQDTAANQQQLAGSTVLFNGSDNGLLDFFVDPALGCRPWKVPDLANNGTAAPALPLDELQAAAFAGQGRGGPAALVPLNDPMTLDGNGNFNTDKTNTYRSLVDQLPNTGESPAEYCGDMESIQGTRLQQDVNLLINQGGPVPAAASNLFTFLAMRLQQSFVNLNCQNFGLQNDVSTTADGNGVVVAACFLQQVNAVTAGAGNPTKGMTVCPATMATASASASSTAAPTTPASATPTPTVAPAPTSSRGERPGPAPRGNAGRDDRRHHHWWW
jgi:hypothetical protein